MQFNITFFLQIINFFITYWFLNRFLFKPVLAYLDNRHKKESKLLDVIKKEQKAIKLLTEEEERVLYQFKSRMFKKYNIVIKKDVDIPSEIKCDIKDIDIESLTKSAEKFLMERIPHVD